MEGYRKWKASKRERGVEEAKPLCCVNVTLPGNGLRTLRPTLVAHQGKEWEQTEEALPYGDALIKRGLPGPRFTLQLSVVRPIRCLAGPGRVRRNGVGYLLESGVGGDRCL